MKKKQCSCYRVYDADGKEITHKVASDILPLQRPVRFIRLKGRSRETMVRTKCCRRKPVVKIEGRWYCSVCVNPWLARAKRQAKYELSLVSLYQERADNLVGLITEVEKGIK